MLDFNPEGKKVILSVDGGGMRGMIPIAMLAELERMTGKSCQQMFDMVAGTSTGAIIAAGLGVGMTANEIMATVYRKSLPKAFPPNNLQLWLRFLLNGLRYIYPLEPFIAGLQPLVEGVKIGDLTHPIVFMTTKDVRIGDTYYVVSRGPGLPAVADWPLSGAVAASGAAPIYFPPVAGNLIDGGVGVNANPCLAVAIEAMEYIGMEAGFIDNNVILISLGTGYTPSLFADGAAARFWLKDWIEYVIGKGLSDASLQQASSTRAIYGSRIDFRRYNPELTVETLRDALGIAPSAVDPTKLGLDSHLEEEVALMEQIGRLYARAIDWERPNVMPWDTVGGHRKPNAIRADVDWSQTPYR
jgi:predicted acylesterase/phospholipase RssA